MFVKENLLTDRFKEPNFDCEILGATSSMYNSTVYIGYIVGDSKDIYPVLWDTYGDCYVAFSNQQLIAYKLESS